MTLAGYRRATRNSLHHTRPCPCHISATRGNYCRGEVGGGRRDSGSENARELMANPSILVVEDDPRIGDLIVKNLEAAGYECHLSADGGRALADHARLKPALVVLDLGLPGIDGLEVTRRIRREDDVPILMVTAH